MWSSAGEYAIQGGLEHGGHRGLEHGGHRVARSARTTKATQQKRLRDLNYDPKSDYIRIGNSAVQPKPPPYALLP